MRNRACEFSITGMILGVCLATLLTACPAAISQDNSQAPSEALSGSGSGATCVAGFAFPGGSCPTINPGEVVYAPGVVCK